MDALAKLSAATTALAEAKTLDEIKHILDLAEAARTYARAAKLGLEAQNHAAEIKLRAERKAGEMLGELERGPHGGDRHSSSFQSGNLNDYRQVLTENDIAPTTAHRWQTVATLPEEVFEEHIAEVKSNGQELTSSGVIRIAQEQSKPHVAHNSGNNEWYTPAEYIEAAKQVLGEIDLDPASSPAANQVVQAKYFLTIEDDGLEHPWYGRVWMNPPYAADLIQKFIDKFAGHVRNGDIEEGIVLVNNATETAWFHQLIEVANAVVFPRGRIRYWQPEGTAGAPLQGQAILYTGSKPLAFLDTFRDFGWGAIF